MRKENADKLGKTVRNGMKIGPASQTIRRSPKYIIIMGQPFYLALHSDGERHSDRRNW